MLWFCKIGQAAISSENRSRSNIVGPCGPLSHADRLFLDKVGYLIQVGGIGLDRAGSHRLSLRSFSGLIRGFRDSGRMCQSHVARRTHQTWAVKVFDRRLMSGSAGTRNHPPLDWLAQCVGLRERPTEIVRWKEWQRTYLKERAREGE